MNMKMSDLPVLKALHRLEANGFIVPGLLTNEARRMLARKAAEGEGEDRNLYHGSSDLEEADCPQCSRKVGKGCLGPTLEDEGPFYHRPRFRAVGLRPEDMDGGLVALFCPKDFGCEHWFDGKCRAELCEGEGDDCDEGPSEVIALSPTNPGRCADCGRNGDRARGDGDEGDRCGHPEQVPVPPAFDVVSFLGLDLERCEAGGDVVISTPTTLTENLYCRNLTIKRGGSIDGVGYRVFASKGISMEGRGPEEDGSEMGWRGLEEGEDDDPEMAWARAFAGDICGYLYRLASWLQIRSGGASRMGERFLHVEVL